MFYQPTFDDDKALAKSFYEALFNCFCEAFDKSAKEILEESYFAIVVSPIEGVRTFFIVAPSKDAAEQLIEQVDSIVKRVSNLMPGVKKTAICFVPAKDPNNKETVDLAKFVPSYVIGKVFTNPDTAETLTD